MIHSPSHTGIRFTAFVWFCAGVAGLSVPALAGPTVGFVENWPGTSLQGWGSGVAISNPGSGGTGGAGDGYLRIDTQAFPGNLGSRCDCPEYTGDWQAAGVLSVKFWLQDVGANDNLEIHFAIGHRLNFWQYNRGFAPPEGTWAQFMVDLTTEANFTQIIGSGSFNQAMQNADRILIRHDTAPYVQSPPSIQADFGLDQLELSSEVVPTLRTTWGRIKTLYR